MRESEHAIYIYVYICITHTYICIYINIYIYIYIHNPPMLKHYMHSIANSGKSYGRNLLLNKLSVDEHIVYDSHINSIMLLIYYDIYICIKCKSIMVFF